jgi:hypothetical protein
VSHGGISRARVRVGDRNHAARRERDVAAREQESSHALAANWSPDPGGWKGTTCRLIPDPSAPSSLPLFLAVDDDHRELTEREPLTFVQTCV